MDIQIRLATAEDMPRILDLQAQSLRKLSVGCYSPSQIESLVDCQGEWRQQSFSIDDEVIYVACLAHQLVAFAGIGTAIPQITAVFVHPNYVRQGIGRALLNKLEEEAISRQYRRLFVTSSLVGIPLYESVGYRRRNRTIIRSSKESIDCMFMDKVLIPDSPKEKKRQLIFNVLFGCIFLVALVVACL